MVLRVQCSIPNEILEEPTQFRSMKLMEKHTEFEVLGFYPEENKAKRFIIIM